MELSLSSCAQTAPAIKVAPSVGQQARFFHPELDILRFFAFSAVFITHSLPRDSYIYERHRIPHLLAEIISSTVRAGTFGVDLFFVLSAYLITELLLREQDATGNISVQQFYLRRALRIWPLYFFFLALAVLLSRVGVSGQFSWLQALAFAGFCGNWYFVFHGLNEGIVGPLWSVSVEEQFYIAWPWVVRGIKLRTLPIVAFGLIIVAMTARALAVGHDAGEFVLWKNTFTRLDPIACGILLAFLFRRNRIILSLSMRALLLAASLVLLISIAHLGNGTDYFLPSNDVWFGYPLAALACSGIFLSMFSSTPTYFPALFRPFLYLGKISYGLYVFHLLSLGLCQRILAPYLKTYGGFGAYWVAAFVLNILLASVSYHGLEHPFLRQKTRFTKIASRPI